MLLLSGALTLVVLLALQAQYAWTHHRETAEGVLRSYARLVGDEFIRRASLDIGYQGFFDVIATLQQRLGGTPAPVLPEPTELPLRAGSGAGGSSELVRTLFLLDPETDRLSNTGTPLDDATAVWLAQEIRSTLLSSGDEASRLFAMRRRSSSGQRIFISTVLPAAQGETRYVAGFEVDRDALTRWFRRMVDVRPLIPASLGDGDLSNDLLFLRLSDETGREIFTSGKWPGSLLAIETPLGDVYSGVFEGLSLQVSIDPRVASRLVIGGLPRSRLPVLLGLMLLTLGLIAAAVWQMRRERALSRMRSEFVARVSHELRTPLTQIRMFAETLLLERTRTDDEHRRSLEIIDQEARRLSHLVANILQFSRAERGTLRLAPQRIDLAGLLADLAEKFAPIASARGTRVVTVLTDGIAVLADEEALRQVVLNLLDNAVRYGPAGQVVRLALHRSGRMARITVEDEGPGIPEPDLERIWQRWQRLGRDEERAISGTGIGLTVVRDLVALHEGRAWAAPGRAGGACFIVELPEADSVEAETSTVTRRKDDAADGAPPGPRKGRREGSA